jgi:hypothetical protein
MFVFFWFMIEEEGEEELQVQRGPGVNAVSIRARRFMIFLFILRRYIFWVVCLLVVGLFHLNSYFLFLLFVYFFCIFLGFSNFLRGVVFLGTFVFFCTQLMGVFPCFFLSLVWNVR